MRSYLGLVISVFILLLVSGCASMPLSSGGSSAKLSASLIKGEYDNIHIPPYVEYEPISLIFTTTEEYDNIDSPFMTYLSLLRKAHELGGHAIVNVSIEENKSCVKTERSVGPYDKDEIVCKYNRFGSALAVKYTKPIMDVNTLQAPVPKTEEPEPAQSKTGLMGGLF
ncbi:MAG: hypothetical protein IJ268_14040 [Proteobacteria bacterium]|nr:hypothetical protein [Pseudomonadota bacterium]